MARGAERFAGTVVVPDVSGGLVRWRGGRAIDPARTPRFQALPGPKPVLGLGGLGRASLWAIVTEGVFDWIALAAWDFPACAALGTQGVERVADALRGSARVGDVGELAALPHGRTAFLRLLSQAARSAR